MDELPSIGSHRSMDSRRGSMSSHRGSTDSHRNVISHRNVDSQRKSEMHLGFTSGDLELLGKATRRSRATHHNSAQQRIPDELPHLTHTDTSVVGARLQCSSDLSLIESPRMNLSAETSYTHESINGSTLDKTKPSNRLIELRQKSITTRDFITARSLDNDAPGALLQGTRRMAKRCSFQLTTPGLDITRLGSLGARRPADLPQGLELTAEDSLPFIRVEDSASRLQLVDELKQQPAANRKGRESSHHITSPLRTPHLSEKRRVSKDGSAVRRKSYAKQISGQGIATGFRLKNQVVGQKALEELKHLFDSMDTTGKGTVTLADIHNSLQNRGASVVNAKGIQLTETVSNDVKRMPRRIRAVCKGGVEDSPFTFLDFLKLMLSNDERDNDVLQAMAKTMITVQVVLGSSEKILIKEHLDKNRTANQACIESMWALWDSDNSGKLDKKQLQAALEMLGVDDVDDFDMLYDQIDKDGSGLIDKDEFMGWWMATNCEAVEQVAFEAARLLKRGNTVKRRT